jgi:GntR family transcriptional regulator
MSVTSHISIDALIVSTDGFSINNEKPKYMRLADAFAECIISGCFKPGQRVPTEMDLAHDLPVSVGTVQKALAKLASSGLVVQNRKTGTYIADRRSQVNEVFVYRFKDPNSGKIMLPFVRTLTVETDQSDGPWRDALGVSRFVRVDRLVWFDQQPPAFSSVYFTYQHGYEYLGIPTEELNGSSLHRMLIERFNLPTLRMEHSISCRSLDGRACSQLKLADKTTGMVWDIKDFSIQDTPLVFQRYQLPPGHRPIEIFEDFSP